MAKKEKIKKATKSIFNRFFGFENGVDITNDVMVLHRRNVVIKNITLVSNLFYSVVLFLFALSSKTQADWLFPSLFFPFTFFLNEVIKKVIYSDRHDKTKQEIGMYGLAIYAFVSVILFYARFYQHYETAIYILIYYAIVIISLYQSKTLILWSAAGMLASITVIHFTWTYNIAEEYSGMSVGEFLRNFVHDQRFNDLLLRTVLFVMFVIVVYAIVSIGHYMQEQRRIELIKRREIQNDFTEIVSDLFKVILASKSPFLDTQHVLLVTEISLYLAKMYGLNETELQSLKDYSMAHLKFNEIEDLVFPKDDKEVDFDALKGKTKLGTTIAKRLQLAQKVEDIARAHIEGSVNDQFVLQMQQIQPEKEAQIILLCDLYVTMRSSKTYKRAYPNDTVIKLFSSQFKAYFDYQLLDRFLRFKKEIQIMYDEF